MLLWPEGRSTGDPVYTEYTASTIHYINYINYINYTQHINHINYFTSPLPLQRPRPYRNLVNRCALCDGAQQHWAITSSRQKGADEDRGGAILLWYEA
jgi:hypothetical protein